MCQPIVDLETAPTEETLGDGTKLIEAAAAVLDLWADGDLAVNAGSSASWEDISEPFQALDEALLPFRKDKDVSSSPNA
jgi:hypothetical protein